MAINRELSQFASFVEVNNTSRNIGIATTATPFVGIGTTNPIAKFEVVGHTELDTVNVSGIVTSANLKVSGIATFSDYAQFSDNASAYFGNGADLRIFHDGSNSYIQEQGEGNLYIQSNSGSVNIRTSATANENAVVANSDGSVDLYYDNSKKFATTGTGATVFGNLVASGIISATTFYGDGSSLSGIVNGIGIRSEGIDVGFGATILDLKGPGVSTITGVSAGIVTIFFEGGGSGSGTIGIGTEFPISPAPSNGDLFYNADYGKLFVFYDENVINGIGTDSYWVDASPFNVGVITALSNVSFTLGSASAPSMYFVGDQQTGLFSPGSGQFTIVSSGSSILNVNPSGLQVTGIVTATDFDSLSDKNYKENVTTVSDALYKVTQMRGVRFDWKESGLPSYGVIAQELQNVLPELVRGQDTKTVNYNGIIGVLIEAIKELKVEIEELKKDK